MEEIIPAFISSRAELLEREFGSIASPLALLAREKERFTAVINKECVVVTGKDNRFRFRFDLGFRFFGGYIPTNVKIFLPTIDPVIGATTGVIMKKIGNDSTFVLHENGNYFIGSFNHYEDVQFLFEEMTTFCSMYLYSM